MDTLGDLAENLPTIQSQVKTIGDVYESGQEKVCPLLPTFAFIVKGADTTYDFFRPKLWFKTLHGLTRSFTKDGAPSSSPPRVQCHSVGRSICVQYLSHLSLFAPGYSGSR